MTTLLLAAHDGATLKDATLKALSAALTIGDDIHVLVAGNGVSAAAAEAAKLKGVSRVLTAEAPSLEHGLAEPLAALIVALAPGRTAVIAPATAVMKNALPRAADGGAGCLAVQGDVDLTGVKLAVENAGALDSGERYAVASWTGSRDGALDESLLPRKWTVAYDDVNGTASLRYAWGTIITIQ